MTVDQSGNLWIAERNNNRIDMYSVPEPSTIALLLASAACLMGYAWRRRRV